MSENSKWFWNDYHQDENTIEVGYVKELEAEVARLKVEVEDVRWGYKELQATIRDFIENVNESC